MIKEIVELKEEDIKTRKLNMMNDALFKAVFRSEAARDIVSGVLCEITGIDKETFLNADFVGGELPIRNIEEKGKASDVVVKVADNCSILIEMNYSYKTNTFKKANGYAYSKYFEISEKNVNIKTKKKEWIYPTVILININNFNHYKVDYPIQEFRIRDQFGNIDDVEDFIRYDLILENLTNPKYNITEELIKFANFLKSKSIKELETLYKGDESYMTVIRKVENLTTSPDFMNLYTASEGYERDMQASIETGYNDGLKEGIEKGIEQGIEKGIEKGIEQGIEKGIEQGIKKGIEQGIEKGIKQGIEQGKIEMAKKMYEDRMDLETISKYSQITLKELKEILEIT